MADSIPAKVTYSVREMAAVLGIGLNSAYDLVHASGFPAVWVSPRRCVIPCDKLQEWLDEQAGNTAALASAASGRTK